MPGGSRKKPFSGKQKKLQLQVKKTRNQYATSARGDDDDGEATVRPTKASANVQQVEGSKFFDRRYIANRMDAGRYALIFRPESKEEVLRLKQEARKEIHPVLEEYLECKSEDFYGCNLDFPIRPPWDYKISRADIDRNENKYFQEYLKQIDEKFEKADLSYFELNLETWRQFWRVLEMSDILLCIVDIRFPPMLFPPKLYEYVCKELGKQIVLVLNKVDICPAPVVLAWKDYFKTVYPSLHVLCFTSYPAYNLHGNQTTSTGLTQSKRVRGRVKMAAEGALELFKVCETLVQGEVDLTGWKQKILEEMNASAADEDEEVKISEGIQSLKQDTDFYEFKKYSGGILTIGCVGQPNVGKSSLINALMGKKVVSVSRTPGHTKHFQTIFLTPNVRLCDCPGLIFPSTVPKPLQVLCGSYPIAQLREPYSTVKFLGERMDLPKIMGLTHPEGEATWSAFDIADGWASKRGYLTAKTARLDSYRGANHILRMALEGRICLCLKPPGYSTAKDALSKDPRLSEIIHIQAKTGVVDSKPVEFNPMAYLDVESDDDEESELDEEGEDTCSDRDGTGADADGDNSEDDNKEKGVETEGKHQKFHKSRKCTVNYSNSVGKAPDIVGDKSTKLRQQSKFGMFGLLSNDGADDDSDTT